MTSGCYLDELEGQRRELEARRSMLEERFKLRLATAQVHHTMFFLLKTHGNREEASPPVYLL